MMDKFKSHFVLLLCYDKIEPEIEAQEMGWGVGGGGVLKTVIFVW